MTLKNLYIFLLVFIIGSILFITCRKITIYKIDSKNLGPRILLIGGTHGNEEAGSIALHRLINLYKKDKFKIKKGSLIIIPSLNKCGLLFNSRYYSRISKDYDLNRLYGTNFFVNSKVEKIIEKIDIVVDLHEGWSFHKINKKSIGSTIITKNIKKKNIDYILNRINKNIKTSYKKFKNINIRNIRNIRNSLIHFLTKKYSNKKFYMLETTGQNNKQQLYIRVNQVINFIESIFSIHGVIK